jgi:hypothetical protein
MKIAANRNAFIIIAITFMWLITIPAEFIFWIRVVDWSINLTLLINLPILGVWIPASYPLAIEANERYRRGRETRSTDVLNRSMLLGGLSASLAACSVWLYSLYRVMMYSGIVTVSLLMCLLIWVVARIVRQLVRGIRRERAAHPQALESTEDTQ